MSNLPELQKIITITKDAGKILLDKFDTGLDIGLKGADEIVTEADRASEAFLLERLPTLLPGSGFFGEETGYHPGESGMTWVVDPLDGPTIIRSEFPFGRVRSACWTQIGYPSWGFWTSPI